jgi:hypothetical protein
MYWDRQMTVMRAHNIQTPAIIVKMQFLSQQVFKIHRTAFEMWRIDISYIIADNLLPQIGC